MKVSGILRHGGRAELMCEDSSIMLHSHQTMPQQPAHSFSKNACSDGWQWATPMRATCVMSRRWEKLNEQIPTLEKLKKRYKIKNVSIKWNSTQWHYKDPPPGPLARVATSDFVAFGVNLALEKHPELRPWVKDRSPSMVKVKEFKTIVNSQWLP